MPTSIRHVALAGTMILASVLPAHAQKAPELFDPGVVHDVRLYIHPNDWRTLQANFTDNTYYQADFVWRNQTMESIGIRSRGRGSRSATKPGLRIDFNRFVKGQELLGLKSIVLDNHTQDASFLKERLSMQLFARMGLPAPRETYARLFINDTYWGLYSIVESIDKEFLKRTLNDSDGYLYEYSWTFPYHFEDLGTDPGAYFPSPFKPQTHEDKPDPSALVALVQAINHAPDDTFVDEISHFLDPRQFLTYLAVESYLAERDGLTGSVGLNNFYLYTMAGSTRSIIIAWDKDAPFWESEQTIGFNFDQNVLVRRLLAVPELRSFFLDTLSGIANESGGEHGWLFQKASDAFEMIRQAAYDDPHKPFTAGEFQGEVDYILNFLRARNGSVFQQIEAARPNAGDSTYKPPAE